MNAIFQNVWEMSLFAIPMILILFLCSNILGKRYGAKWKYLLWLVIAVRLCIPVQLSLPDFMMGLQVSVPSIQNETRAILSERTEMFLIEETTLEPVPIDTVIAEDRTQPPAVNLDPNSSYQNPVDFFLAYPDVLWSIGVLAFLLWQGWKYACFKRFLKHNRRKVVDVTVRDCYNSLCKEMNMKKRPDIHLCEALSSPLCIGLLKPEVYINTEGREITELRLILKHELMHCKRNDLWFKGILMLAKAIHFFNPFVHWMAKLAEKDMEFSCDLAVMENCDLEERGAYSMAILRTVKESSHKNMQMSTAFSGGKEELKARFENIFDMTVKKRGIALFTAVAIAVCGGTAFVGCTAPEPKEAPETRVVYGGYTEQIVKELYAAKLQYVGDHVGVGQIFGRLLLPEGVSFHEEGMELFTHATPYGAKWHLNWTETEETVYELDGESYEDDRWFRIHALIFLTLVDNADYFGYELHRDGTGVSFGKSFDREMAKEYFGDKDLREFATDEETFMNFVSAINRYFYEGITKPEQIHAITEYGNAEAAQARMNDMLYGGKTVDLSETGLEDTSMLYQMIHADSLVYEIVNERGLTSSNPLDYIQCDAYEELVKIGEPALREFLASFAEGRVGDSLEGYIMMFACQDILGETRRTDLKPTEWYWLYAALDSTLAVNFVYDPLVYTPELEKNYSLGMNHVDDCSIIQAGKDERVKAVYDAIENRYNPKGIALSHETSIYAPYIYKIHEEGNRMQVFTTIFEQRYVLTRTQQGYGFFERGGSVVPTRLDFEKQNDEWVLQKWTEAEDGNRYADSIEEMCKGHMGLAKVMMVGEEYDMLLWQNIIYYMNAHYGGLNIPVYISSYTDAGTLQEVSKYTKVISMFE